MKLFGITAAILATILGLTGCSGRPLSKNPPVFTPENVHRVERLPGDIRRVLVMPVYGGPALTEGSLTSVETACISELNRTGRFEVVPLSRDVLASLTGQRQFASVERLPRAALEKLVNLDNRYGADAILFIDVTTYSPYPPLQLGLRAKLARVSDNEILWAADNVFAASNPTVANAALKHAKALGSDRGKTDLSHTVLQSPSRFAGYAAAATFETLPAR